MEIAILLIGDEVITGQIADSNGAFIARLLRESGFTVVEFRTVRDQVAEIERAVRELSSRVKVIISSGGLGPTSDDLTRDGIAAALGVPLTLSESSLRNMEERYRARSLPLNRISERQCFFPEGSVIYSNPVGTADTFCSEFTSGCFIFSLPGVPKELKTIFTDQVLPWLFTLAPEITPPIAHHLKCFGVSESHLGSVVESLELPKSIVIGYRPVTPELWLRLTECSSDREAGSTILREAVARIRGAVGDEFFFSEDEKETLASSVGALLTARGATVAFAESCSGGRIADLIVSNAGASAYFKGSLVTYANDAKENFLGVSHEALERFGAVSPAVALQMAHGAKVRSNATLAVSVTGIAGPDGGSEEKPVGTVFFGITDGVTEAVVRKQFLRDRNTFRAFCAGTALDLVRRFILGFPLEFERR